MRLAITGGTGRVGRFLVAEALAAGDTVTALGRRPPPADAFAAPLRHLPYDLREGTVPDLSGIDALVHAALLHVPGRYRGGEGDDPAGFRAANLDGTLRLFRAAARAGVPRIVFLSSRAVYGPRSSEARLHEDGPCAPDTLYGRVKLEAERGLAALPVASVSLRATGVYGPAGPGQRHKWAELFARFAAGEAIAPRTGSEVHGADLAAALRLCLTADPASLPPVLNVSDLLLDRRDLLARYAALAGIDRPLPPADPARAAFNEMDTDRLRGLGWRPGGWPRLDAFLAGLAAGPGG